LVRRVQGEKEEMFTERGTGRGGGRDDNRKRDAEKPLRRE
jgi:hypothetical protein